MKISAVYMDNHATTPLDPRVREAMAPYLNEAFGNPSSRTHAFGWQAEMAVEKARGQVAALLGARPDQIVFTSGATESNNLAILGLLPLPNGSGRGHMICGATEHKAVLEVSDEAARRGAGVTVLPVDNHGRMTVEAVAKALRPDTRLVSVMTANNEIGTVNPIAEIGRLSSERGIWLHTDAAQAVGRVPIKVDEWGIDLLSLSGHKIYGPKGVGALFIRRDRVPLRPIAFGGQQEWGLRPGTLNVPGIVGLGAACEIAGLEMESENRRLKEWRDRLVQTVLKEVPGSRLNGHPDARLAGNISLSFGGLKSDLFSMGLGGLACSSGSACSSASGHPSHVLKAIGVGPELARATLRLGLGRFTTAAEVDKCLEIILAMAKKNQDLSPA
jgi:cysteine desulfurase